MAQPVDVGSVLGGRYKVTARVLVSGEQDVVLDGVDQVLNRPVSILVAGPDNGDHLTQGAREVATGERHANLQILDLGSSDDATYLIANQSPAAELLDLVVPTDPYVEPFFTDTLGQEIFGMPRPEAPDNYRQYDYVYEDDSPVELDGNDAPPASERQPPPAPPVRKAPERPAAGGGQNAGQKTPARTQQGAPTAGQVPADGQAPAAAQGPADGQAPAASQGPAAAPRPARPVAPIPPAPIQSDTGNLPPAPPAPPSIIPTTAVPSAEYIPGPSEAPVPSPTPRTAPQPAQDQRAASSPATRPATRPSAGAAGGGAPAAASAATAIPPTTGSRAPANARTEAANPKVTLWSEDDFGEANGAPGLPAGATTASGDRPASNFPLSARQASTGYDEDVTDYEDDEENAPRTGGRWLVGGVVAILVIAALIFAVTTIGGGLFGNKNAAAPTSGQTQAQTGGQSAAGSSAAQSAAAPVVAPVIGSVTRLVPDAPDMGKDYDAKLPATFDGNPGTYWQTLEFSNDNFAGLTSSVNLVVQLKQVSDIKTVTLTQLGGSGGSFKLLTNSQPSLDGAKEIGTGSFTAPDITLPAPQGTKAQYVIISFTQLPKQQSFQTYPYAAKIAEISIK